MKEKILEIINTHSDGRKITNLIKNTPEIKDWIDSQFNETTDVKFAEKVYQSVLGQKPICQYGNSYKFKTIKTGYGYCGRAESCQCQRENISVTSIENWGNKTQKEKQNINEKRDKTNLKIHGVENIGQCKKAIQSRSDFYQDKNKVDDMVNRVRKTKKQRHGDKNYNNLEKARKTNRKKYGTDYYMQTDEYKKSRKQSVLKRAPEKIAMYDMDELQDLADRMSLTEMAQHMGYANASVIVQKLKQNNIQYKKGQIVSIYEDQIAEYISTHYSGKMHRNTRKVLNSLELDFYLPKLNLAIEFNGAYWHSDQFKDRDYHYKKYQECKEKGITLIQIWEQHWVNKKAIIKNKLKILLGVNQEKVYARKCEIRSIDAKTARAFCETYHLHGYASSSSRYGLFHNDNLVAVMTFSRSKAGIGNKERRDNYYELSRFCSKGQVVGGASRLLKAFISEVQPEQIKTYSYNDYGSGDFYKTLGFQFSHETAPSYRYVVNNTLEEYHRYNFAKHKLIEAGHDPDKTEFQITDELGLLRIWDSGNKVWTWGRS